MIQEHRHEYQYGKETFPSPRFARLQCARFVAGVILVALALYLLALARGPVTTARGSIEGDARVLTAAKHFDEDGFRRCGFLPVVDPGQLTDPPRITINQPLGPYIVAGLVRRMGARRIQTFRIVPAMLTVLALALLYLAIERVLGLGVSLFALFFAATTPALLAWADMLDSSGYDPFFLYLTLACWTWSLASKGKASLPLAILTWLAAFGGALFSYYSILFVQVFIWSGALAVGSKAHKRGLVLFLAAPALALAIQLGLAAAAIGPEATMARFEAVLLQRTPEVAPSVMLEPPAAYPLRLAGRIERWYMNPLQGLLFWALAISLLWKLRGVEKARTFLRISVILAAGAAAWWIVFPKHTWVHEATIRQLIPFFAMITGAGVFLFMKLSFSEDTFPAVRVFAAILCVVVMSWQGHRLLSYSAKQFSARDSSQGMVMLKLALPEDAVLFTDSPHPLMLAHLLDRPVLSTRGLPGVLDDARSRWPGQEMMLLVHAPLTGFDRSPASLTMEIFFGSDSPETEIVGADAAGERLGSYVLFLREQPAAQSQDAGEGL